MRKEFFETLYKEMQKDSNIWLICLDLGFGLADKIKEDFPERFINPGASEFSGMGMATGLALEGKRVFIYSITTFLLYRPFEIIRNYISYENIPIVLVGSGRDKNYLHDGFSHWSTDAPAFLRLFPNIIKRFPNENREILGIFKEIKKQNQPFFISLTR